jgi:hypothetical protein
VEQFAVSGDNQKVKVKSLGRDQVLGLHKGDWVEVLDDATELRNQPGTLAKIDDIDIEHKVLILNTAITGYDLNQHAKVRRWDSDGELTVEVPLTNDGYIPIEDGVEIKFDLGHFNVGDYWLIPARTVPGQFGDIEWPRDSANDPLPQLAFGIHHHYCRLGVRDREREARGVIVLARLAHRGGRVGDDGERAGAGAILRRVVEGDLGLRAGGQGRHGRLAARRGRRGIAVVEARHRRRRGLAAGVSDARRHVDDLALLRRVRREGQCRGGHAIQPEGAG